MRRLATGLLCLLLPTLALPHQLDEYLQVAVVSIKPDHVGLTMFLTPGVAVFKRTMALMDTNGDGVLSDAERKAYATRFVKDLSLNIDGHPAKLSLLSYSFPTVDQMRAGAGYLELHLKAATSPTQGAHQVTFQNHHQKTIAAYMVNCIVPEDPALKVTGQTRVRDQSSYAVSYQLSR